MTLSQLLNLPCTLIRQSTSTDHASGGDVGQDTYGNPIPADPDDSTSDDNYDLDTVCELQQIRRDEPGTEGEMSDTYWLCFLPAGTVLDTSDKISVAGYGDFEVVGDPWRARNPRTQVESHLEITLRRTGPGPEGS